MGLTSSFRIQGAVGWRPDWEGVLAMTGRGLRFGVLGPLLVEHDGQPVRLPRSQVRRGLLGVLLAAEGEPLGPERLVELVWGRPTEGVRPGSVHVAISRLRQWLATLPQPVGEPLRVEHGPSGYRLSVGTAAVDLSRFRSLVSQAEQAADPGTRLRLLRTAIRLSRGPLLHDLPMVDRGGPPLGGIEAEVRAAGLALARSAIDAGDPDAALDWLESHADREPLDEPVHAALLAALAASGRPAEALTRYERLRHHLAAALGVSPSEELQQAHTAVLAQDRSVAAESPVATPAQLPGDVPGFAGRGDHLARLDTVLAAAAAQTPTAVVITAVSGTAGVGKTALAVRWAHSVAVRFPDGQLYVNLRGFDAGGQVVDAAAAVRGFLDALGVPTERIPGDLAAQAALYRSLLAGKRMLVVLDNARDADHVRPLLPGTGTALAIVTSRNELTSLVAADGAQPLVLDLLTVDESRELLARRIDPRRLAAEPAAVEDIVTACAGLPLALALVAARAATHPGFGLAALAAELAAVGDHAGRLDADVVSQVRAVFSWSYTTLSPDVARLFRLLGLHPGPHISAAAAASLTATSPADARRSLAELSSAGLLTEHAPGRYGFHDLLRTYATDLTQADDTADERRAATTRLLDHYTHTAHAAARLLFPTKDPIQIPLRPPAAGTTPERLADLPAAMAWLAAEHPILLAMQRLAATTAHDTQTWQLAWSLDTFLDRQAHWHDLVRVWQNALAVAGRLGSPAATADTYRRLAWADSLLGHQEQAHTHLRRALELFADAGDLSGQAHTQLSLGGLWDRQDRPDRALHHAQQALTLYRATGDRSGEAGALNAVGWCHALLGDHAQALSCCEQALPLFQQVGDRDGEAASWDSLGFAHHNLGHHAHALDCYQHAVRLYQDLGDRYEEAATLTRLGDTHAAADAPGAARAAWTDALGILADLDHPAAATVRTKLGNLDRTSPPATVPARPGAGEV